MANGRESRRTGVGTKGDGAAVGKRRRKEKMEEARTHPCQCHRREAVPGELRFLARVSMTLTREDPRCRESAHPHPVADEENDAPRHAARRRRPADARTRRRRADTSFDRACRCLIPDLPLWEQKFFFSPEWTVPDCPPFLWATHPTILIESIVSERRRENRPSLLAFAVSIVRLSVFVVACRESCLKERGTGEGLLWTGYNAAREGFPRGSLRPAMKLLSGSFFPILSPLKRCRLGNGSVIVMVSGTCG